MKSVKEEKNHHLVETVPLVAVGFSEGTVGFPDDDEPRPVVNSVRDVGEDVLGSLVTLKGIKNKFFNKRSNKSLAKNYMA